MKTQLSGCILALALAFLSPPAWALTVTIDLNGFVSAGGAITGEGIAEPVPIPASEQKITLENLLPGTTYHVDFFHNSGELGSDFDFVTTKDGTGIDNVTPGGEKHTMVVDFKKGDTNLKLFTAPITFNPDKSQTGEYFITGMTPNKIERNSGPVTAKLIPGRYTVDNSGGPSGANLYDFVVDSKGNTAPAPHYEEFVVCAGNEVRPRVAKVHFKIVATAPIEYTVTHQISNATTTTETTNEFVMLMPVTGGGVTISTFGKSKITASTLAYPDGTLFQGSEGTDDVTFTPRLGFDARRGFFFETTRGPATMVYADVVGTKDDKKTEIKAKITATIVLPPKPAANPPAATTAPSRPGPGLRPPAGVSGPAHSGPAR